MKVLAAEVMNMSFLDSFRQRQNLGLIRRFELASGHAPIATLAPPELRTVTREVACSSTWDTLSEQTRALVEQSEATRSQAEATPRLFLSK